MRSRRKVEHYVLALGEHAVQRRLVCERHGVLRHDDLARGGALALRELDRERPRLGWRARPLARGRVPLHAGHLLVGRPALEVGHGDGVLDAGQIGAERGALPLRVEGNHAVGDRGQVLDGGFVLVRHGAGGRPGPALERVVREGKKNFLILMLHLILLGHKDQIQLLYQEGVYACIHFHIDNKILLSLYNLFVLYVF